MLRPEVNWLQCQACDPCLAYKSCKLRAVVQIDPGEPAYIDLSRCNGCGHCIPACPHDAIQMTNHSTGSQR